MPEHHPLRPPARAGWRDLREPVAWFAIGASGFLAWIALVYAVGA